jgi:hypothetical protein
MNQLANEQGNAQTANTNAVNSAANNAQLALQAMTQQGQLGGQIQGQSNQMATNAAQAAQQVAQYNSQLQSTANQYNTQNANQAQAANLANAQAISGANTGLANQRTMYNAQVPETVYNNQLSKANDMAGVYEKQGQLAQQQAGSQNAFTGNLIGTAGTLAGAYFGGPMGAAAGNAIGNSISGNDAVSSGYGSTPNAANQNNMNPNDYGYAMGGDVKCYAQGGEVHDHSLCMKVGGQVPGDDSGAPPMQDSTANDTVPAKLSPHEIVLPRSVAQAPNAPQAASQFVAKTKGLQPTAGSFSEVLKLLEANGLELRLSQKGA